MEESEIGFSGAKSQEIVNARKCYASGDVYEAIRDLETAFPDLFHSSDIGESVFGQKIPLLCLGKGKKQACVAAGLHAREAVTINFVLKMAEEYASAYYAQERVRSLVPRERAGPMNLSCSILPSSYHMRDLLDRYTLYILPMCNPDGTDIFWGKRKPAAIMEGFDRWIYKNNGNNVNLNANFPFCWEEIQGKEKGERAAGEPETRALMKLIRENHFRWLLDFHVNGNMIFWRDNKNGGIPGDYALTAALSCACGYGIEPVTTDASAYGGGFENYFRHVSGKPGLCVELVNPWAVADYTYAEYPLIFEKAVNWSRTRYTVAEAMRVG